ncbi:MAG: prepilin-type N-terminal cleavage/methylation protein [Clostridia bacterium]|jgi:prepilin-type N-terminal cleavage/methylation domain-containing protein|nr:prepilin-type N-terminal cleavage/methylation protein [Clostridia bacterium]
MKTKFADKGFTLIELVVIVAIMGIMAAFIVPSLYGYKKTAVEGERQRLEMAINKGLIQYYSFRGEYPNPKVGGVPIGIGLLSEAELTALSEEIDKVTGTTMKNTVLDYEDQFEYKKTAFTHDGATGPFRIEVTLKTDSPWR